MSFLRLNRKREEVTVVEEEQVEVDIIEQKSGFLAADIDDVVEEEANIISSEFGVQTRRKTAESLGDERKGGDDKQKRLISGEHSHNVKKPGGGAKKRRRTPVTKDFYFCNQCVAKFLKLSEYLAHVRCHQEADAREAEEEQQHRLQQQSQSGKKRSLRYSSSKHDVVTFEDVSTDFCYHCRDCGRCFKDPESLERHRNLVHQDLLVDVESVSTTFDCSACDASFEDEKDLLQHVQDIHEPGTEFITYPCDQCDKVFPKQRSLMSHRRSVHGVRKQKVPVPERQKSINSFICTVCDTVAFETRLELANHMKRHHTPRSYRCPRCSQVFGELKNLRQHERLAHNRPLLKESRSGYSAIYTSAEFVCDLCVPPRAFELKEMLENHMDTHKGDPRKWRRQYACPECGETFTKVVEMREHLHRDHRIAQQYEEESGIQCSDYSDTDCSEVFSKPSMMSDHLMAIHSIGHPHALYTCYICQKPFQTKCGINNHVESQHSEKGPMPFQCQQCGRKYATKHNWRKHCKTHSEGSEYYVCKKCGNKYLHTNSLQYHEKTCRGPKSNTQKRQLIPESEIQDDGTEVFPCEICGARLKNLRSLRNHQRSTHWMYVKPKKVKLPIRTPMFIYRPYGESSHEYTEAGGTYNYKRFLQYNGRTIAVPRRAVDHDYLEPGIEYALDEEIDDSDVVYEQEEDFDPNE